MRVAVAKEIQPGERRVALTPDVVGRLVKKGTEVWVEAGAGDSACFSDAAYEAAGAEIIKDSQRLWREGRVILKVNPLGDRPKFRDYSPNPDYLASEFFQITVPLDELRDPERATVNTMTLAWNRIGPWLPWMKMGDRPGQLVYHAYGRRVSSYDVLSPLLRQEIKQRLPKYRHAPTSYTQKTNMTSWRYFEEHFDAYLQGDPFPINERV